MRIGGKFARAVRFEQTACKHPVEAGDIFFSKRQPDGSRIVLCRRCALDMFKQTKRWRVQQGGRA